MMLQERLSSSEAVDLPLAASEAPQKVFVQGRAVLGCRGLPPDLRKIMAGTFQKPCSTPTTRYFSGIETGKRQNQGTRVKPRTGVSDDNHHEWQSRGHSWDNWEGYTEPNWQEWSNKSGTNREDWDGDTGHGWDDWEDSTGYSWDSKASKTTDAIQ